MSIINQVSKIKHGTVVTASVFAWMMLITLHIPMSVNGMESWKKNRHLVTLQPSSSSSKRTSSSLTLPQRCAFHHSHHPRNRSRTNGRSLPSSTISTSQSTSTSTSLQMALLPIPVPKLDQLLTSALPTPLQYATYWGRTSRETYNALFEAFGVGFLGVFCAYFMSFVVGDFIATVLGMVAGFWVLLGPELKAYQRNWELRGGRELVDPWMVSSSLRRSRRRDDDYDYDYDDMDVAEDKRGLYGAYYLGRIEHLAVVEDPAAPPSEEYDLDEFQNYTMETDELERDTGLPYRLRLYLTDGPDTQNAREMQLHARMNEEYLSLQVGMPIIGILLSTSQSFATLAGLTDFCVPDADGGPVYVGDYPYLDRSVLEEELVEDEGLWEALLEEGRGCWGTAALYSSKGVSVARGRSDVNVSRSSGGRRRGRR